MTTSVDSVTNRGLLSLTFGDGKEGEEFLKDATKRSLL